MAHEVFRLVNKRLFNKPHLINLESFNEIVSYLEDRNTVDLAVNPQTQPSPKMDMHIHNGVAFLPVNGALTYESTGFEALCGMQSYQRLQSMFDKALTSGVHTVVLDVDSPGGEAYGAFETGKYIRDKADEAGVKLVSYVDGLAASAGYVLASAAHEVISNPYAEAGSIGVVIKLTNTEKAKEAMGLETTYVFAGDSKIPYDAEGNFAESFLEELQTKVDTLYTEFTSYVAEMRSMDQQEVINTQAKTFIAKDALEIGLVDSLLTREEFFKKLAQDKEGGDAMPLVKSEIGDNKQMSEQENLEAEKLEVETLEASMEALDQVAELEAKIAEMEAKLAESDSAKAELAEQAKQKELAELQTKASAWEFAGLDNEAYAVAAYEGAIPVEMFDTAMESAAKQLAEQEQANADLKTEFEALGESGIATNEVEASSEVEDGVEKYLKTINKIKV